MSGHNIKNMVDREITPGTGRWYKFTSKTGVVTGRANINESVASIVPWPNGLEVIVGYNEENDEICIRPLKY